MAEKKTLAGEPVVCCKCFKWLDSDSFRKNEGWFYCPECFARFSKMRAEKTVAAD